MKKQKDTKELDRCIGQRIVIRRSMMGLPIAELAKKVGISVQLMEAYEKGHKHIGIHHLWPLAREMGVPMEYFCEGYEIADGDHVVIMPKDLLDEETRRLIRSYHGITSALIRQKLFELITAMVKQY